MSAREHDYFLDDRAARAKLEAVTWPNGPVCPRCANRDRVYDLGKIRRGLKKCGHCRRQFTILTGTIFEASHMPLQKWILAIYLISAARNGNTIHKIRRALAIGLDAASSVTQRIRAALRHARLPSRMRPIEIKPPGPRAIESTADFDAILAQVLSVKVSRRAKRTLQKWPRKRGV